MLRRLIATVLVPSIVGCTTFGVVDPKQFIVAKRPLDVWVSRPDSSVVHLFRPRFLGDTLVGFVNGKYGIIEPTEIRSVQARRPAPGRTALLVIGSIATVGVLAVLLNGSGEAPVPPDSGGADVTGILLQ